jgi:hypothetical protein
MKKIILNIIALTTLALASTQTGTAQTIVNGSFENGDTSWYESAATSAEKFKTNNSSSQAYLPAGWAMKTYYGRVFWAGAGSPLGALAPDSGSYFIGVSVSDSNVTSIYSEITGLVVGQTYTISGYVRARAERDTNFGIWRAAISDAPLIDSQNATKTGGTSVAGGGEGEATISLSWVSFSGQFTATSTSAWINLAYWSSYVNDQGSSATDQTVFFDKLTITSNIPEPRTHAMVLVLFILPVTLFVYRRRQVRK